MSLVLNTNISSMQAQNNLAKTQSQQATTFERLSTGLRVNSAKDDAAGLYLAQAQSKDITGLNMATRNAGDGISLAQTAEGALDQIGANLQRINELAVQSANGTYSDEARSALQLEVDELTQEINRIVETTEFNGRKLLNAEAESYTMQIGFKNEASSRIDTGLEDGILNGRLLPEDGTLSYTFGNGEQMFSLDPDDVVNGRTSADNVVEAFNAETAAEFGLDIDTTNGQFDIGSAMASELDSWLGGLDNTVVGINDADGTQNYTVTTNINGIEFTATIVAASGTSTSLANATFGGLEATVNGETVTVGTVTLDQWDAAGAYATGNGTSEFQVAIGGEGEPIEFVDEVAVWTDNALVGILDGGLDSTQTVNISTQENAQFAIQQTREAIDFVSELRAEFGANQNRFEAVISGNQTYSENLSAARSRIQDADFAVETANLAKQQVLQQAGISALGQANASGQAILGLL